MFDLISVIKASGYLGVSAIVFAESGILLGLFLPGDSLLFTAGFLASQDFFDVWLMALLVFISAVLGDSVGYAFGKKIGPKIFTKEESLFFQKAHLLRASDFYQKHGGKTLILARFLPVVRTFAPILAGVGKMNYGRFLAYNIIGAALWGAGIVFLGYFLGSVIPGVDKYLLPIIAAIILFTTAPVLYKLLKDKESRNNIMRFIKTRK